MKIATLQFSPKVGAVQANVEQAELLLRRSERKQRLTDLDLLVLPEMAFTGYNFASREAIEPYLEPTAAGLSTQWAVRTARRLKCTVAVGYPEIACPNLASSPIILDTEGERLVAAYNSLVFVDARGEVVAHTRKAFLYYTDDTWAREGPAGFFQGLIPLGHACEQMPAAAGICMDINPYKFQAPWTAFEFASHCREAAAKLIVVSMAWLTRLPDEQLFGWIDGSSKAIRRLPDMDTVSYWIERFRPLLHAAGGREEVIVVFANRAGEEGTAPIVGDVRYAGSSCIMGMRAAGVDGEANVSIWNIMGRAENGVLVVDTCDQPIYRVRQKTADPIIDDPSAADDLPADLPTGPDSL